MLKKNAQPIATILSEFFDENPELKTSVLNTCVSAWRKVLPKGSHTQNVYLPEVTSVSHRCACRMSMNNELMTS